MSHDPTPELPPVSDSTTPSSSKEDPPVTKFPLELSPRVRRVFAGFALLLLFVVAFLIGRAFAPHAGDGAPAPGALATDGKPTIWTCSMHPQIQLPEPGDCPICGMDLIPLVEDDDPDASPRVLKLTPAAAALAEVEVTPVVRRPVAKRLRLVGVVDYDETRLKFITAWIPGRLDRLFVDFTGTRVRPGDHLVELYSPELLAAQEELLQAREGLRRLGESQSDLLRESAQGTVESAREKLRLWGLTREQIEEIQRKGETTDHVTIYAPIGGVVVHKNKNQGEYVKTGERIYTIADLDQVWVKLDAYESDLPWIRYGQPVTFETEAFPGQTFTGRVVFVDPVVTPGTRTVKVRLNVVNPEGRLKPGMFVRATVEAALDDEGLAMDPALVGQWICPMHGEVIEEEPGACRICGMPLVPAESLHEPALPQSEPPLVVPTSAVLWTGVRSLVYVRVPGDVPRFEGREVTLGPRAGQHYVIRDGLREGELVASRGAFKIDSALQIEARPSMMSSEGEGRSGAAHEHASAGEAASPQRLSAPPRLLRELGPLYAASLRLQEELAADDLGGAKAAAAELARVADGLSTVGSGDEALDLEAPTRQAWAALRARLLEAGRAVAEATSLEAARAAFAAGARATLDLVRTFGHTPAEGVPATLHEAFCPMALDDQGAAWLQAGEEIANPYFGASMLRCGELREAFEADAAAPGVRPPGASSDDGASSPANEPGSGSDPKDPAEDHADGHADVPGDEASFRRQLDRVLEEYLKLQVDLAADRAGSAERLTRLGDALGDVEPSLLPPDQRASWSELRPRLAQAVAGLSGAVGLKEQRARFEALSDALSVALARLGVAEGRTVRRFHCSMAGDDGADWLQVGPLTANPYFGSGMLRCGDEVEVLPAGRAR